MLARPRDHHITALGLVGIKPANKVAHSRIIVSHAQADDLNLIYVVLTWYKAGVGRPEWREWCRKRLTSESSRRGRGGGSAGPGWAESWGWRPDWRRTRWPPVGSCPCRARCTRAQRRAGGRIWPRSLQSVKRDKMRLLSKYIYLKYMYMKLVWVHSPSPFIQSSRALF